MVGSRQLAQVQEWGLPPDCRLRVRSP